MNSTAKYFVATGIVLLFLVIGCTQTDHLWRRSDLTGARKPENITVLGKDSTTYRLSNFTLEDSTIAGSGTARKAGKVTAFDGRIALKDIALIETQSKNYGKALLTAGVAVAFISILSAGDNATTGNGLTVQEYITYPGGGGSSCPSIYSWDGSGYRLEGEAFGTALGKGLEMQTLSVLPALRVDGSGVRIRIKNERPETHFLNAVNLRAVEVDAAADVVADPDSTLWPVHRLSAPLAARDDAGNNILEQVRSRDTRYWEANMDQPDAINRIGDTTLYEFAIPGSATEGSLVVTALNTNFSATVFEKIGDFVGDESAEFVYQVEHDPELIRSIKEYVVESALKVEYWDGTAWQPSGTILPEATNVPFTRLVRIPATVASNGIARIRMIGMKDVWMLDAVGADWAPAQPLRQMPVSMVSALGPDSADASRSLGAADGSYLTLLPPEAVELTFRPATSQKTGTKIVYALAVRGYLHEWMSKSSGGASAWSALFPGSERIALLKTLLPHKAVFLPPMYAAWKERRNGKWKMEEGK